MTDKVIENRERINETFGIRRSKKLKHCFEETSFKKKIVTDIAKIHIKFLNHISMN